MNSNQSLNSNHSLIHLRITNKKHMVVSTNKKGDIVLSVQYKGVKAIRAMLVDGPKSITTSILLDYIQLVIVQKKLTEVTFSILGGPNED